MEKKKLLMAKIVFVLAGLLFLSSCSDDNYRSGEDEPSAYWGKYSVSVGQNQWQWDRDRECYYYVVTPSPTWLTEYIALNGIVQVLIDTGNTFQPLPYVAHYYQQTGASSGYFFTETISCEFDINYLRFNVAASDLFDNTDPNYLPQSYVFQVRLVW
ncbi:MAG: hypothetical protein LBR34_09225 [Prevotella sp.]|jgi:hypothetical protein|nr:hypothetical protein [Prevotella sp.]